MGQVSPAAGGEVNTLNTRPQLRQVRRPPDTAYEFLVVDLHQHHDIEGLAEILQQALERGRLGQIAWEAVQNKALATSGRARRSWIIPSTIASSTSLPASITDFAAMPSLVLRGHRGAQQITGRDLGNVMAFNQALGLSALARPGGVPTVRFA